VFFIFGNTLGENSPPCILFKNITVLLQLNNNILVLHLVIWVGNDVLLTTQNTKSRVGENENRGGKVKKNSIPDWNGILLHFASQEHDWSGTCTPMTMDRSGLD